MIVIEVLGRPTADAAWPSHVLGILFARKAILLMRSRPVFSPASPLMPVGPRPVSGIGHPILMILLLFRGSNRISDLQVADVARGALAAGLPRPIGMWAFAVCSGRGYR